jgi:hypothetical protein
MPKCGGQKLDRAASFAKDAQKIACGQPKLAFYCFQAMEFAVPNGKTARPRTLSGLIVSVLMTPTDGR